MPQFYTLLTDTGQAKLANAVALGQTIEITEMAVGDGGGSLPTPDSSAEALINEVRRAPINASQTDPDNPSWIVVEQVLPPDVGGWTIREIGIYDVDGDLIGIGNYPETYKPVLAEGSSRTQTVRFVLEVSETSAVTLKVDPSVVLATREYVDQERAAHEASRVHPAATESLQGMIKRATKAKALAGTDNIDAMTSLRVFQAFSQFGLGAPAKSIPDIDGLNIPPGIFAVDADNGQAPGTYPLGFGAGTVAVWEEGPNSLKTQWLASGGSSFDDGDSRVFVRRYYNGSSTWSPWRELLHDGNLVKASDAEALAGTQEKYPDADQVHQAFSQYGLGATPVPELTISIDSLVIPSGTYLVRPENTGTLPVASGGVLTHIQRIESGGSEQATQWYTLDNDAGVAYVRTMKSGAYGAWRRIFHDGNLVQSTVDQQGLVEKATPGEAKSGAVNKWPDAAGMLEAIQQFGIGTQAADTVADFDALVGGGIYKASGSAINGPAGWPGGMVLVGTRDDGAYAYQMAFDVTAGECHLRTRNASAWLDWQRLAHGGNEQQVGVSQTWEDLSSSRSGGVTYTNTTGKPILLAVTSDNNGNVDVIVDDLKIAELGDTENGGDRSNICVAVPDGSTYRLNGWANGSANWWSELR